jgi:hypothetical protein
MTKKYVIRSSVMNTYVSNTDKWVTDCWTEDINEAKVFEDFDDALNALTAIADYFHDMGWGYYGHAIYEVVTTVSLGDKIPIDNKDTVLKLLDAIQCCGVRKVDVPDMQRIINYVKTKGT